MKITSRFTLPSLALVAIAMLLAKQPKCCQAEWGVFRAERQQGDQSHCAPCPKCGYVCKFKAEKVDEQHHRFDAEAEVICIPRVVFPWQMQNGVPCTHNGARLRTIHVMTKESYSCPKCNYTWKAVRLNADGTEAVDDSEAKKKSETDPNSPKPELSPKSKPNANAPETTQPKPDFEAKALDSKVAQKSTDVGDNRVKNKNKDDKDDKDDDDGDDDDDDDEAVKAPMGSASQPQPYSYFPIKPMFQY